MVSGAAGPAWAVWPEGGADGGGVVVMALFPIVLDKRLLRRGGTMQGCTAQAAGRIGRRAIAKAEGNGENDTSAICTLRQPMNRSSPRPLIGISACLKENGRGGWHHTVGEKYVQAAIRAVGGLPVLIPAIGADFGDEPGFLDAMDRLLDGLDGVLLTGSPSNVEPHHYGKESRDGTLHDRGARLRRPCR